MRSCAACLKAESKTIRATNDQHHILRIELPIFELAGRSHGGQLAATFVQCHNTCAGMCFGALTLGGINRFQRLGQTRLCFNGLDVDFELRREAFGIVVPGRLRPIYMLLPTAMTIIFIALDE